MARRASSVTAGPRGSTAATAAAATSGRTRTTTRASPSTRRPSIPRELYIPDLSAKIAQIGSGSSYVIAELDGAFTKYYEATVETEYHGKKTFLRGSYTWSHYYGNFDQDSTSTVNNDQNIFIGSSNIGDGAGRQLWDMKTAISTATARTCSSSTGRTSSAGTPTPARSSSPSPGTPWEAWNYELYKSLTSSTSDTIRYAEPAGSRRTRRPLPARPQLHAELPVPRPLQRADRRGFVQRGKQPDGLQHPAEHAQLAVRPAADTTGIRDGSRCVQAQFKVLGPGSRARVKVRVGAGGADGRALWVPDSGALSTSALGLGLPAPA